MAQRWRRNAAGVRVLEKLGDKEMLAWGKFEK